VFPQLEQHLHAAGSVNFTAHVTDRSRTVRAPAVGDVVPLIGGTKAAEKYETWEYQKPKASKYIHAPNRGERNCKK
jgi:hypothetical protein